MQSISNYKQNNAKNNNDIAESNLLLTKNTVK